MSNNRNTKIKIEKNKNKTKQIKTFRFKAQHLEMLVI